MKERRKHIEKPWNTVHHFGTSISLPHIIKREVEATNNTIYLKEQTQNYDEEWFDKGHYQANVIRVYTTISHQIPEGDSIVAYWPRPSSSNVLEGLKNDSLLPRERIVLDYLDRDSCVTHGYIYELLYGSGNTIGWLPNDTLAFKPRFEYTVLSQDSLAPVANINEDEKTGLAVELFPNPSSSVHTLRIRGELGLYYNIEMYDLHGRKVSHSTNGIFTDEKIELLNDVSFLANGLYVYHISLGETITAIKFIKH